MNPVGSFICPFIWGLHGHKKPIATITTSCCLLSVYIFCLKYIFSQHGHSILLLLKQKHNTALFPSIPWVAFSYFSLEAKENIVLWVFLDCCHMGHATTLMEKLRTSLRTCLLITDDAPSFLWNTISLGHLSNPAQNLTGHRAQSVIQELKINLEELGAKDTIIRICQISVVDCNRGFKKGEVKEY